MAAFKSVKQILGKPSAHWVGDGFNVFPVFANKAFTNELSPFLMFDYAAPKEFPPTERKLGVGTHPHKGMETVTIAFQGEVEHSDSLGNNDVIQEGDCQWMTAGRGIEHNEFHSRKFAKSGGTFEMCQLWVNLPAKDKLVKGGYQAIKGADMAVAQLVSAADGAAADVGEGSVRVIAGAFGDAKGPASTHSQIDLWDVSLKAAGKEYLFRFVEGNNVVLFCRRGRFSVANGGAEVGPQDVAILGQENTSVVLSALENDTSILVMAGMPLNEPIAAQGPFVMNTQAELRQAFMDYQMGNFGK